MGDTHHDPTDHSRTTQPHAGITMKDNLFWPGFILLAVALSGVIAVVGTVTVVGTLSAQSSRMDFAISIACGPPVG